MYINAEEEMYPNKNDVPAIYTTSSVIIDEKQIKHTAPPRLLDLAGLSSALQKIWSEYCFANLSENVRKTNCILSKNRR